MARAAPDEPDGPRPRQRDFDPPPEFHRNRTLEAERRDDPAHRRLPGGAAPSAQRNAARRRIRPRLSRAPARQPRNDRDEGHRRPCTERARALSRARGRSALEHGRRERRHRDPDRGRVPCPARAAGQRATHRAPSGRAGAADRQPCRMARAYPAPAGSADRGERRFRARRAARRNRRLPRAAGRSGCS